ncbi:unnamed protein product [Aspergillus oryzae]|nr:unnamed protein product [Aspergillus oryzae]GMF87791.1 unnamed protein product [Aspergillus oryzae]
MNPQDSAVWRWLRDVPCATVATPPDTAPSTPLGDLIRKRTMTTRSTSPAKRQRILDDNQVSDLYDALTCAGAGDVLSQTTDSHTKRRLLFSGLEVKHENGGKDEALAQLATWIVAGMENTRKLWSQSSEEVHSYRDLPPMVGWTIVGLGWYTWVTFGATNNGTDRLVCNSASTRFELD